jgi:hypothetical protein
VRAGYALRSVRRNRGIDGPKVQLAVFGGPTSVSERLRTGSFDPKARDVEGEGFHRRPGVCFGKVYRILEMSMSSRWATYQTTKEITQS